MQIHNHDNQRRRLVLNRVTFAFVSCCSDNEGPFDSGVTFVSDDGLMLCDVTNQVKGG